MNYEVVVNPDGQTKVFHINLHADRMLRLLNHNLPMILTIKETYDQTIRSMTQKIQIGEQLQKKQVLEAMKLFPSVIAKEPGMTNLITHFIPTTDCTQIRQHPYWISLAYPEEMNYH